MRPKTESVFRFEWESKSLPKIVRQFRRKYKGVDRLLDRNPAVLTLVDGDLQKLSPKRRRRRGRKAVYTSENILRALLVLCIEGLPFRETVIRIGECPFLQDFCRLADRPVMDFTFLNKCFKAIDPETWKRINDVLALEAVKDEVVDPSVVRMDTTVVESNIHYPTDASLLWDTWRVAYRLLSHARAIAPRCCPGRFHTKKARREFLFVTRYATSRSKKTQRKVRSTFRIFIARVRRILAAAEAFCAMAPRSGSFELLGIGAELSGFLPHMHRVVSCAERAQVHKETVPAAERVFSIFEPHTELIRRGRRSKPVEFGHKVLLTQSAEKFILDYETFAQKQADNDLAPVVAARHEALYGAVPDVMAGDRGFNPKSEARQTLEEAVDFLAVPRRAQDFGDRLMVKWQMFRAGIEGTISGLKRAFRLVRCFFRSFRSFAAGIGLGVVGHNLVVLAQHEGG